MNHKKVLKAVIFQYSTVQTLQVLIVKIVSEFFKNQGKGTLIF